jgi:DNA-directed RNA polymerase subunit M/transcription elongation factor TFIIS
MQFCPKCGSLLQVTKKGAKCPKCKYQTETKPEKVKANSVACGKPIEIAVIDKKAASLRRLPIVRVICQSCGHTESETWQVEVANETIHKSVTFFRCTRCGATKREDG